MSKKNTIVLSIAVAAVLSCSGPAALAATTDPCVGKGPMELADCQREQRALGAMQAKVGTQTSQNTAASQKMRSMMKNIR